MLVIGNLLIMTKVSKFEPWEYEDSERLSALWADLQEKNPITQTQFAKQFGLGSQGNVGHYINKRQPLNLDAVIKFAEGLGCSIDDISPTLADKIMDAARKIKNREDASHWPIRAMSPSEYAKLDEFDKGEVEGLLKAKAIKLRTQHKSAA